MGFQTVLAELARAVAERGLALIVATATLMSLVHFRNSHLSERARANAAEFLYNLPSLLPAQQAIKDEHSESLRLQAEWFVTRYKRTSTAFVCLVVTLVLLMFAIVFCSIPNESLHVLGLALAIVGVICLGGALIILVSEFKSGDKTLERHISIMRRKI